MLSVLLQTAQEGLFLRKCRRRDATLEVGVRKKKYGGIPLTVSQIKSRNF